MRKNHFAVFLMLLLGSCAAKSSRDLPAAETFPLIQSGYSPEGNGQELPAALDDLAELERQGGFVPGLGLAESKIREEAGDYAGAVLAVYKELSWAYALGAGDVSKEAIRQGLENLLESLIEEKNAFAPKAQEEIAAAVKALLSFMEAFKQLLFSSNYLCYTFHTGHSFDGFVVIAS